MRFAIMTAALALAACGDGGPGGDVPGDADDARPFAAIAAGETVHFSGTGALWGGEVDGGTMIYRVAEDGEPLAIPVERFAGRNGVSWTGAIEGEPVTLALTPGACRDAETGRIYPYWAMFDRGGDTQEGCGWTDAQPYRNGRAAEMTETDGGEE